MGRWLRGPSRWIYPTCGSNWASFAAIAASPSTTGRRSLRSVRAFAELCNDDEDLNSWLLKNLVDFQFPYGAESIDAFLEVLQGRRSIRTVFLRDKPVPDKLIERILEAARW